MSGRLLWQIAATFASLSLVSIGGANAVVPEIHRQIVECQGWMNDTTFTSLFAISQAAPGPNVLLVSLIGWHMAGFAGLVIATVAMVLPSSLLAFLAGRFVSQWHKTRWIKIAKAGLEPIALGLILASGVVMARAADHHALSALITIATAAFVVFSRRNPLSALAAATVIGIIAARTGIPF
jgi:chromate transporter